jgi:hypothetical protein
MAKFMIKEVIDSSVVPQTVRLGAGTGAANHLTDVEQGKFVKFAGESRYQLAAAGDLIEGHIVAVEGATADDYTIGSIVKEGAKEVMFDGLQATPGVGVVAIGDFVVVGTVVAKGTTLGNDVAKVGKATLQPGTTEAAAVGDVNDHIKASMYAWKVVSLGSAGTGAVGTTGVIERVGA